jgi:hypothetical protein
MSHEMESEFSDGASILEHRFCFRQLFNVLGRAFLVECSCVQYFGKL